MAKKILLDENLVIEKYDELKSVIKVGEFFGVSVSPITRILKSNKIYFGTRKYSVNHTYFDVIDSEEKAYWLGFLSADGYIRERKGGRSLDLKLSQLDVGHMELFRKDIGSSHKIKSYVSKTYDKYGKECTSNGVIISIYSNRLVESIKTQGFHARKTFTIDKPNIQEQYYRHYIRGFFDGDGCCYIRKKNNQLITSFAISCASPNLKKFFIDEFEKNSINYTIKDKLTMVINQSTSSFKFYNYLYDNANIFLKRKKDKSDIFVSYYTMKKNKGIYCFQDDYIPKERRKTKNNRRKLPSVDSNPQPLFGELLIS